MARRVSPVVLASTTLGTMDSNALVPVIAFYAASVGADVVTTGIIIGLFSAVHAPANLLFGRVADRIGRKLPFRVGLLWDAVSLFLYSLATTPLLLALVRVSHGIGSGFVGPSSMALVADTSTPDRKGRAMAVYGISLAVAVVIGFAIAGPIVARLGYPVLFYVLSGGALLGFALSNFVVEPSKAIPKAMPWRRLATYAWQPGPAAGYAAIFSLYFILGAFVTLVPFQLRQELGYGALAVGFSFTAFAVLSLLLHYPAGVLADRYGPALPAGIGLVAVAVAMALIPLLRDLPTLIVLMALFGVGHGFIFPAASALVSRDAEADQHGLVMGLLYALLVTGVAIGAPAMASIAARTTVGVGIWASSWVALFGLAFLARSLDARRPPVSTETVAVPTGAGSDSQPGPADVRRL